MFDESNQRFHYCINSGCILSKLIGDINYTLVSKTSFHFAQYHGRMNCYVYKLHSGEQDFVLRRAFEICEIHLDKHVFLATMFSNALLHCSDLICCFTILLHYSINIFFKFNKFFDKQSLKSSFCTSVSTNF